MGVSPEANVVKFLNLARPKGELQDAVHVKTHEKFNLLTSRF